MKIEKVIILLVIGVFIMTSIDSLNGLGDPVTEEEAIEISRNSELVEEGIAAYGYFGVRASYYNSSWVEHMKRGHAREMYERVPEGHSIWKVVWTFNPQGGLMIGYTVVVIVDAETGTIVHGTKGVGYG